MKHVIPTAQIISFHHSTGDSLELAIFLEAEGLRKRMHQVKPPYTTKRYD